MSDAINDGGPAFPQIDNTGQNGDGMSLRDWFAGQALQAIIAKMPEARFAADPASYEKAAMAAFYYADAMLAARKGGDA